jgi:hypothetical protein
LGTNPGQDQHAMRRQLSNKHAQPITVASARQNEPTTTKSLHQNYAVDNAAFVTAAVSPCAGCACLSAAAATPDGAHQAYHGLRTAGRFASLHSHLATRNTASGYVAMLPPVHHADQHDLPWLT